jgi:hypothetical protein
MDTLRSLRLAAGYSFEQLADEVTNEVGESVAWQTVQGWEHRGIRDASRVIALASIYNKTPQEITRAAEASRISPNVPRLQRGRKNIASAI